MRWRNGARTMRKPSQMIRINCVRVQLRVGQEWWIIKGAAHPSFTIYWLKHLQYLQVKFCKDLRCKVLWFPTSDWKRIIWKCTNKCKKKKSNYSRNEFFAAFSPEIGLVEWGAFAGFFFFFFWRIVKFFDMKWRNFKNIWLLYNLLKQL